MKQYTIGIDIGGTNTDAVLIDKNAKIKAACKIPTQKPLEAGVQKAITTLLDESCVEKSFLKGIYVGTTHATNAVLEAKGLFKVGVLRLAAQKPLTLDPCFKWPEAIHKAILTGMKSVQGGYRCDRMEMAPLSRSEIETALLELIDSGMESLAIVGVFSPLSQEQEVFVKEVAQALLGQKFPVTLSSDIGGMGFIERENAAILNAALKKTMAQSFQNMEAMKQSLGIDAPLFVTQNDGSMITLEQAIDKPLLTISSGPTNSFIGAVKLARLEEAIIVDVGGTSADIGIVLNGYPRRSLGQAMIGGIPLNFRMPDVLSLPIGGGSVIRRHNNGYSFGPDSIGSRLFQESCLFGGQTITLTCAAAVCGLIAQKGPIPLSKNDAAGILSNALGKLHDAVRIMRGNKKSLPVLAVGGGAFFLKNIADAIPENSGVANAYGAALAEVSCTVDTVVCLIDRERAVSSIKERAIQGACDKGADAKGVRIVDIQVIPYHYIPSKMGRIVVTASGAGI